MKNLYLSLLIVVATSCFVNGQTLSEELRLRDLHTIKTVTLSPSYSFRSSEEFSTGYAGTSLFLSDYSKQTNTPALVFNGACESEDRFNSSTAGDEFSLIADLGSKVSLEEISATRAFNLNKIASFDEYSRFARNVKVIANHKYAVLLNESDTRGLFVFEVVEHVPNKKVVLRYAVKSYEIHPSSRRRSEGFNWTTKNNL